jgi:hypothetical protein
MYNSCSFCPVLWVYDYPSGLPIKHEWRKGVKSNILVLNSKCPYLIQSCFLGREWRETFSKVFVVLYLRKNIYLKMANNLYICTVYDCHWLLWIQYIVFFTELSKIYENVVLHWYYSRRTLFNLILFNSSHRENLKLKYCIKNLIKRLQFHPAKLAILFLRLGELYFDTRTSQMGDFILAVKRDSSVRLFFCLFSSCFDRTYLEVFWILPVFN